MNETPLKDDLHHFRLDNGYSVRIIEPMKAFHLTYADEGRGQMIDLQIEAVSPAVLFADGKHFEQVMRVRGDITIRGHSHKVDCFNVRDRSWGKPRPEQSMTLPPMSWTTAVFNEGFSVNCNVFDQVEGNSELRGSAFEVPKEKTLLSGWTWKGGEIAQVIEATKRVVRDPESLIPLELTLDLADSLGREFHMTGELIANCPWQTWPNVNMSMSLMKWRWEDQETHGDCQEAIFGDYYNFRARTR
jgi:hypothetical protein